MLFIFLTVKNKFKNITNFKQNPNNKWREFDLLSTKKNPNILSKICNIE